MKQHNFLYTGANLTGETTETKTFGALDSIAETDTEQDGEQEEEISETAHGFTDDTTTEDEAPELQVSDDEAGDDLSDTEENSAEIAEDNTKSLSMALPSAPRHMTCSEDEDFVSALDKMVSDNIQDRMRESVKPSQVDISVPLSVRSGKKTYEQLQVCSFYSTIN